MSQIGGEPSAEYSRAFENFVTEADDIAGLIAYALYKRSIRERRAFGFSVPLPAERNPQRHEVEVHRNQAESYLRTFASSTIEAEKPAIMAEAIGKLGSEIKADIVASTREMKTQIKSSAGFWPGVLVSVVGWFISILITIAVLYSAPDWAKSLVQHINQK